MLFILNYLYNYLRISDLEYVGGKFIRDKLIELKLFKRKYSGDLTLEGKVYHVTVEVSLLGGAQIASLPIAKYDNSKEKADSAREELQDQVRSLYKRNVNNIKKKQRQRLYYSAIAVLTTVLAIGVIVCTIWFAIQSRFAQQDMITLIIAILMLIFSSKLYASAQ